MHKTNNICFPRSGHRLLGGMVEEYFRKRCISGDIHGNTGFKDKHDCNFQKNHDFDLKTKIKADGMKYVIQIRYPLESIVSFYILKEKNKDTTRTGDRKKWETFALMNIKYWNEFYDKWVNSKVKMHKTIINYADLVDNPIVEFEKVVRLISLKPVDKERIEHIVSNMIIERRSSILNFKYYNKAFFTRLRGLIRKSPNIDITNDTLTI